VHRLPVRVVTELAWHSLFIQHLLIEPEAGELQSFDPQFTIIDFPGFQADPAIHGTSSGTVIAVIVRKEARPDRRHVLRGRNEEVRLHDPELPSAAQEGHADALLGQCRQVERKAPSSSAFPAPARRRCRRIRTARLIGDDEHGWSEHGVFNFEGGCYAKMIRLSPEAEPEIFATTKRFGTVLENVVIDEHTRELDLNDATLAENSRGAYPISYIPNASTTGITGQPSNIVMLTADAFGVLPPIARLTPSQAMYHFLSGFTAKVAGTEKGLGKEPQPTFSTCFGAPFMPRHPTEYGNLLRDLIAAHKVDCWLVNTGWTGGAFGTGSPHADQGHPRPSLGGPGRHAEDGRDAQGPALRLPMCPWRFPAWIRRSSTRARPGPTRPPTTSRRIKLVQMFRDNFKKFEAHVGADVKAAAPKLAEAAE
jgi:phosphoenolpyruvate carboxykinase (ATP)